MRMALSRKYYVEEAKDIAREKRIGVNSKYVKNKITDYKADNPRFDPKKFKMAIKKYRTTKQPAHKKYKGDWIKRNLGF